MTIKSNECHSLEQAKLRDLEQHDALKQLTLTCTNKDLEENKILTKLTQVQDNYQHLIGVSVDLVQALENTISGKIVSLGI